jgi:hypothetical protein
LQHTEEGAHYGRAPSSARACRPYLYAAVVSGALSLPFVLIKTAMLQHSSLHRTQWPSHLAIYAAHAGFSIAHMVAAQRVVTWAQRRYEMGLLGFGYPWEVRAARRGTGGRACCIAGPARLLALPACHRGPVCSVAWFLMAFWCSLWAESFLSRA